MREKLRQISRLLEVGRARKAKMETFELALENFAEAHAIATVLHDSLQLSGLKSFWKFAAWLLPILLAIGVGLVFRFV